MLINASRNKIKTLLRISIFSFLLFSITNVSALDTVTIVREDLVLNLGEGLTTEAQLTSPTVGDGPFPVVLLIPGGGLTDMNEYIPAEIS